MFIFIACSAFVDERFVAGKEAKMFNIEYHVTFSLHGIILAYIENYSRSGTITFDKGTRKPRKIYASDFLRNEKVTKAEFIFHLQFRTAFKYPKEK